MIRIGTSGWNYKDWAGIVYPPNRPKDFSEPGYLAQYFDALEINTSFYGPPRPSSSAKWTEAVSHNPNFRFTAKLYRGFTHERNASPKDEKLFKEGVEPIATADRLGAILLQFPISFKNTPEELAYLLRLCDRFREYPLVVEVRHASWDNAAVLDLLAEREIGVCNIDQPLLGRALKPAAHGTGPIGYVRLHGRNYRTWFAENKTVNERYDYLYSVGELEPWIERIKAIGQKTKDTYAMSNNHHIGKAVANSLEMTAILKEKPVAAPKSLIDNYPEMKAFTT